MSAERESFFIFSVCLSIMVLSSICEQCVELPGTINYNSQSSFVALFDL